MQLRTELDARHEKIRTLEAASAARPLSRERLPPVEGFSSAVGAEEAGAAGAAGVAVAVRSGGGSSMKGGGSGSSGARPGSGNGSRRASGEVRTLSRPGSSRAVGSSGVPAPGAAAAAVAMGLPASNVLARELALSSAGGVEAAGMEPAPWDTGAASDTDAGTDWAGAVTDCSAATSATAEGHDAAGAASAVQAVAVE